MRLALLFALCAVTTTANSEGWICASDSAAGFKYNIDTKRWTPQIFNSDLKYVIRRPSSDDMQMLNSPPEWVVQETGVRFPAAICWDAADKHSMLNCDGLGGWFQLKTDSLDFLRVHPGTYFAPKALAATKPAASSVTMEIGRCTPL